MRYLGIDYGTKRVGLALSDESGSMGFPHAVVPTGGIESAFVKLFAEQRIDAVVMGESHDLSGKENPVAQEARRFAAWIEQQFAVPVQWESEVYTSAEARRQHERSGKSRKPMQHEEVDASAAALILTSYLNKHGQA